MTKSLDKPFYKLLYGGFVLFGAYHAIFNQQYGDAAMNFGIALAFDPFDQSVSWKERPIWQRAWLIVHLGVAAAFLGLEVGLGSK